MYAKRFGTGQWSFIGPGSEKSGIVQVNTVHQEYGTIWRKGCWRSSQKVDIQSSVLQGLSPEVDSKAKVMENCRYTIQPIWKRLRQFFA